MTDPIKRRTCGSIQITSDLHLELRTHPVDYAKLIRPEAPILVLAGDIGQLRPNSLSPFLRYCSANWKHVIYVAGNHEFYDRRSYRSRILSQIRSEVDKLPNVYFLDRNSVEIDGQRYLGCTLWSNPPSTRDDLNDFTYIYTRELPSDGGGGEGQGEERDSRRWKLTPRKMAEWHQFDVDWLQRTATKDDIIITHFMPFTTAQLIRWGHLSKYESSELDLYFGNTDCNSIPAKLWISGHTHQAFHVRTDTLEWICNPLGLEEMEPESTSPSTKKCNRLLLD